MPVIAARETPGLIPNPEAKPGCAGVLVGCGSPREPPVLASSPHREKI